MLLKIYLSFFLKERAKKADAAGMLREKKENFMEFRCEKNELLRAVNTVSRAAAAKSPMAVLEGILVEAGAETVRFTGYDLKRGIHTDAEAAVSEPGSIVLGARIFENIVRSLPNGDVTVRTSDGNTALITCQNSEFSIIGTDFSDYPELPGVESQAGVSLPRSILSSMIRQTLFAVSDNEARPVYTGAMFEVEKGCLTVVAVDGYRLALRREKREEEPGEYSFIVPGRALSDLEKLCADAEGNVRITLGDKHIRFTMGKTVLISRRLEGEFLNYHKAVPAMFSNYLKAERGALQRAVERVSLIIDDKVKNPVRCTFERDSVRMVCSTALGKAEDVCPLTGDGGGMEIGFNNRYLLDALKAAPAEDLTVCLNGSLAPCVIRPAGDEDDSFLYMILPVRLKAE